MAHTTYSDGSTVITAGTMNDLDRLHYGIFGDPADLAAVKTLLFTNPMFVAPELGTPASGNLANCSGLPVTAVSGTKVQFNAACTDADFATLADPETLTNKVLSSPIIDGQFIMLRDAGTYQIFFAPETKPNINGTILYLAAGSCSSGPGGDLHLNSGSGSTYSGDIDMSTAPVLGNISSGAVVVASGTSEIGTSGSVTVTSGATGPGGTSTSGAVTVTSGGGFSVIGPVVVVGGSGPFCAGGNVSIDGGTGTTNGTVSVGATDASAVTVGRTGITTAINGQATVAANTAPANASASGTAGMIRWDANYIYLCVAENTWRRVAHASW